MDRPLRIFLADLVHDGFPDRICAPLGIGFIGEFLRRRYGREVDVRLFKSPGTLLEAVRTMPAADVVGLSNYSWNVEISKFVRARIKAALSDAVIIGGGPHIRTEEDGIATYLRDHSDIDYYVMYEGEFALANLVGHMLSHGGPIRAQSCDRPIAGVAYLSDGTLVYESRASTKGDLEQVPSPYLSGSLDGFIESPLYLPLLETNRGCPFACTFCAWGIAAMNKVRRFETAHVIEEIDYIVRRSEANIWYLTDANFGMFPRDIEIAEALRRAVEESNFLRRISINWAKNSSRYCTEIAHILKGICSPLVAVQSTDPVVLHNIKRDNIKMSTITDLVAQGRSDGVPMTTDVLAGLPGETLESHFNTLRDVFAIGFESFNVGQIRLLPGSEMERQTTQELYKIKTKFRPIPSFSGVYDGEIVCEYEETVVETGTMTREDMYTLRAIHFLIWALWNSGLGQPLLRYLFREEGSNPLDSILCLLADDTPQEVKPYIDDYKQEARSEWYDSPEELLADYRDGYFRPERREYLKLNLKYLARLMLDPELARDVLQTIAMRFDDPILSELVEFCMARIYFVDGRVRSKKSVYSKTLVQTLQSLYPKLGASDGTTCRFSVNEKFHAGFNRELERFEFDADALRCVTMALQSYSLSVVYDFSFGCRIESVKDQGFVDSFDYADQLKDTSGEEPAWTS